MMDVVNVNGGICASGDSVLEILERETSLYVHPIERKSFRGAKLNRLMLKNAKLVASSVDGSARVSDFLGADFSWSNLECAEFVGLDLRGANFTRCNLNGASFYLCKLDGARFDRARVQVNFTSCTIQHVKATGSNFAGAVIKVESDSRTPAANSVFIDCDFSGVTFRGDWSNSTFVGCDLTDSRPGSHRESGALFMTNLFDCKTYGMLLANCRLTPSIMSDGFVFMPDESWDEWGFETYEVDGSLDWSNG